MKKTVTFKSKGLVLLDSGQFEPMARLEANSKDELMSKLNELEKDGMLGALGYGGQVGGIIGIAEETSIDINGDEYVNTKMYLEFIGKLSQKKMEKLQKMYFDYLVVTK